MIPPIDSLLVLLSSAAVFVDETHYSQLFIYICSLYPEDGMRRSVLPLIVQIRYQDSVEKGLILKVQTDSKMRKN